MYSIYDSQFSFANNLTTEQQIKYQYLDCRLQNIISDYLLSSGKTEDIDIAYATFDILGFCSNRELQDTVSIFLITLLEFSYTLKEMGGQAAAPIVPIKSYLLSTLELIKKGGEKAFFTCASTHKNQYYSAQTLIEIIGLFHKIYQKNNHFPIFSYYDKGGKEQIIHYIEGFHQVKTLSSPPKNLPKSTSEVTTPSTFSDLLTSDFDFRKMKSTATQYLSSLSERNRSAMVEYAKFFRELQNEFDKQTMENSEVVALSKLVLATTVCCISPIFYQFSGVDFSELLAESRILGEKWGGEMLVFISESRDFQKEASFSELLRLIRCLNMNESNLEFEEIVYDNLDAFKKGEISLDCFLEKLRDQIVDSFSDLNVEEDLKITLDKFTNVPFPLSEENLLSIGHQYQSVQRYCEIWKKDRIDQLVNKAAKINQKAKNSQLTEDEVIQLVAIGRLAIHIKFSVYLYNTQVLALLGIMLFQKGAIAEIKTGEGKSLIIALLAFILCMKDNRVHLVSSSQQLAVRDEKNTADFFKIFGLKTTNICENNPTQERFQGDLVYGTASNFQFGILREMLHFKTLFPETVDLTSPDKRFDVVIIDEADNLTIDSALNEAREGIQAEISYNWVYHPIYQFVERKIDTVKIDTKNDVEELKIFFQGYMGGLYSASLQQVPDDKLATWISSAYIAFHRKEAESYVIIKEEEGGRFVDKIVIIDAKNTGQRMHGVRWSEGIHEFIEVKHGINVEEETLKPLSISNALFYQMHMVCYGLTGTLGSQIERNSVKEIYEMDSFDVPPYKTQIRKDSPLIIYPSNQEQFQAILESVIARHDKKQPILLICKTIKESEFFGKLLKNASIQFEMFNEMQKKTSQEIIEKAGVPGAITIATNNSGRGTDIKLREESIREGGLHVILTFCPESDRIEGQVRGRAGRQGQPGSSEMILSAEKLGFQKLTDSNDIFKLLAFQRYQQVNLKKSSQLYLSKIKSYIFTLSSAFYKELAEFHRLIEDQKFLQDLAIPLNDRNLILKKDQKFTHLNFNDRRIAEDAFKLLSSGKGTIDCWKSILKESIKRIEKKVIAEWAIHFYQPVSDLVHKSNFSDASLSGLMKLLLLSIQNSTLEETSKQVDAEMLKFTDYKMNKLLREIFFLFEKRKIEWGKYLDSSGDGVMLYLREITGQGLQFIGHSSHLLEQKKSANVKISITEPFPISEDALEKSALFLIIEKALMEQTDLNAVKLTKIQIPLNTFTSNGENNLNIGLKALENSSHKVPSSSSAEVKYAQGNYGKLNGSKFNSQMLSMCQSFDIMPLPNIVNSCYINSIIQLLLTMDPDDLNVIVSGIKTDNKDKEEVYNNLRSALSNLIEEYRNKEFTEEKLKTLSGMLRLAIFIFGKQEFLISDITSQQDAAALLDVFLEGSPVKYRSSIQFKPMEGDKPVLPRTELFSKIMLPIETKNNIFDCLNEYSIENIFDEDNKFAIESENEHAVETSEGNFRYTKEYSKHIQLDQAPPKYLFVHLKRFHCNKEGITTKLEKEIEFPAKINLDFFATENVKNAYANQLTYEPVGFISHHGDSLLSGHYTAEVKRKDKWFRCDDSIVENITFAKNTNSYLVMLKRLDDNG